MGCMPHRTGFIDAPFAADLSVMRTCCMVTAGLEGTWRGEYRYSPARKLSPVSFELVLESRAAGIFAGTVQDGPGGMPDLGAISGRVFGPVVLFHKRMPRLMVAHEGAVLTYQEYLDAVSPGHSV